MATKFVFITGGVVSSLGKGITAAALGRLLKCRGYSVSVCKLDPYLNVDPGTMNPYQHGEVYVTDDGAETDLDIGHYERFIDETLSRDNNATSGQIYQTVIERERAGGYHGGTVQIIPHITDEITARILRAARRTNPDVLIVEIGGTVGDIEGQPFLEAIRQLRWSVGAQNSVFVHVTLIPYLHAAGELKSKPTQHSVKELLSIGIQPDILVCRSEMPVPKEMREKIARFCNVDADCVIQNLNAPSLYAVPLLLEEEGLCRAICRKLGLAQREPALAAWREMVHREQFPQKECRIALVGKYVQLQDAYLSIVESLKHAGIANDTRVKIAMVQAEDVQAENAAALLGAADGILIPGGFGTRGLEGKIAAARYARENGVPLLGICLGMQMAVVEYARNVLGYADANSSEVEPKTQYPVIDLMEDQRQNVDAESGAMKIGGTLRLGGYDCALAPNTLAARLYGKPLVRERHRHRYEFNNAFRAAFEGAGMVLSGCNPQRGLVEIVELPDHPFYIGVQFHPEFQSRPDQPHPLFVGLVAAALAARAARR